MGNGIQWDDDAPAATGIQWDDEPALPARRASGGREPDVREPDGSVAPILPADQDWQDAGSGPPAARDHRFDAEVVVAGRPGAAPSVEVSRRFANAEGLEVDERLPNMPVTQSPGPQPKPEPSIIDQAKHYLKPTATIPLPWGQLTQDVVKAGIGKIQETVGRPVAEGVAAFQDLQGVGMSPESRAAKDQLTREALSLVGGEGMVKDSKSYPAGQKALQDTLGGVGTDIVRGVARSAPLAPLALPAGGGAAFATRFPTLSTIVRLAGEGALGGAVEGMAIKSQDPGESMAVGAAGGAVLGSVGMGLVKGAKAGMAAARRVIGRITDPSIMKILASEVESLHKLPKGDWSISADDLRGSVETGFHHWSDDFRAKSGVLPEGVRAKQKTDPDAAFKDMETREWMKERAHAEKLVREGPRKSDPEAGTAKGPAKKATPETPKVKGDTAGMTPAEKNEIRSITPPEGQQNPSLKGFEPGLPSKGPNAETAPFMERVADPHAKDFHPAVGFLVQGETGPVLRLTELSPGGSPKFSDLPINLASRADFDKAGKLLESKGVAFGGASDSLSNQLQDVSDSIKGPLFSRSKAPDLDASPLDHAPRPVDVVTEGPQVKFAQPPPPPAEALAEAAAPLRAEGGGNLGPPPPPPPAEPPSSSFDGNFPPSAKKEIDGLVQSIQKLARSRDPGILDRIAGGALADHHRGYEEVRHLIAQAQASPALYQNRTELLRALRAELPSKNVYDSASTMLNDVALGKVVDGKRVTLEDLGKAHPQVGKHLHRLAQDMMAEMDRLQRSIAEKGGIDPKLVEMRDNGEIDQYVAQMYRAHVMEKGKWGSITPSDTIEQGVKFFINEAKAKGIGWSPDEIRAGVLELMGSGADVDAFKASSLGAAFKHLKGRKNLPPAVKALLGEENSGPIRVAFTLAAQRAINNQLDVWDKIVKGGTWFSPTPIANETLGVWAKVPDNKRYFGRAAGGYVHPDLIPLIETGKDITAHSWALNNAIGAWFKSNVLTFGGFVPFANQFIRGWKGAYFSGGLDMLRPKESGKAMMNAIKLMADWHGVELRAPGMKKGLTLKKANPTDAAGDNLLAEARRMGALPPGFGLTETTPQMQKQFFSQLVKQLEKQVGDNEAPTVFSIMEAARKVVDTYRDAKGQAAFVYDSLEQFWKLSSYISLRQKNLREAVKQGLSGQQAVEFAAAKSAALINRYFANFEHIGRVADKIRKTPFGAAAPFFTGFWEDMRVNGMIAKDAVTDPRVMAKAVGLGVTFYGAKILNEEMRKLNGITDEHIEQIYKTRAEKDKEFYPDATIWTTPFLDSKGKAIQYNLAQPFPELQLLQGPSDDPTWKNILVNLITSPMSEGGKELFRQGLATAGVARPMRKREGMYIEGNTGMKQLLDLMAKHGGLPRGPFDMMNIARQAEVMGVRAPTEERYAPETAALRAGGLAVRPGVTPASQDPKSPTRRKQVEEYLGDQGNLEAQINAVAKARGKGLLTDEEARARLMAIREQWLKRAGQVREGTEAIQRARGNQK